MRRVLIFTYYWPPAGGPGVQRFLKFTKYFKEFDWEPIVVTPENGSYPYTDESLLNDIPKGLEVVKTKTFEPFKIYNLLTGKRGKSVPVGMIGMRDSKSIVKRFSNYIRANYFIPDARKGWVKYAVKAGKAIIENAEIDAIITTGPPHSTHLTGLALQQKYHLPWIADMRDPWTNIYYNRFLPRSKRVIKKDKALENLVVNQADAVTVISAGLKEEFKDRARKIEIIYNGFDAEDMHEYTQHKPVEFTLSYIGNLKPNQNIPAVWEAIAELASEDKEIQNQFKIQFTGNVDPAIIEQFKALQIERLLEVSPFVPHHEATRLMQKSAALLFIVPQAENNKLIITGKLFEYLASRTPMLSIGPTNGDAARILDDCHREKMMDYDAKDSIKLRLKEMFEQWKNAVSLFKHTDHSHEKYSRRDQTGELATLLNAIV
jgi:glycosyltransferase involved in cell wall biosynthesis